MPSALSEIKHVNCYIKENSWIAALAAKKLRANAVAIVIGKTIHLHNASRQQLFSNKRWLRHEIKHLLQYKQFGLLPFLGRYLWETIRKGYVNNKYEVEARAAETDETIAEGFVFL